MRLTLATFAAPVLLATGCALMRPAPSLAYRACFTRPGERWCALAEPPALSAVLLSMANPPTTPPFHGQEVRIFWFDDAGGNVYLCAAVIDRQRTEPVHDGCGAAWYEFTKSEQGLVLTRQGVIACGAD